MQKQIKRQSAAEKRLYECKAKPVKEPSTITSVALEEPTTIIPTINKTCTVPSSSIDVAEVEVVEQVTSRGRAIKQPQRFKN